MGTGLGYLGGVLRQWVVCLSCAPVCEAGGCVSVRVVCVRVCVPRCVYVCVLYLCVPVCVSVSVCMYVSE